MLNNMILFDFVKHFRKIMSLNDFYQKHFKNLESKAQKLKSVFRKYWPPQNPNF